MKMKLALTIAILALSLIIGMFVVSSPQWVRSTKLYPFEEKIEDQLKIGNTYDDVSNILLKKLNFDSIQPWDNQQNNSQIIKAVNRSFAESFDLRGGPLTYDVVVEAHFDKDKRLISKEVHYWPHGF